ncbi:hypothetical protein HDU87_004287 [Geranomyces variabilis]|uniref:Uncharacterized protein n=1 Tax=Geranomyces variabilis TaxID=109894 RepID=A0AAD5XQU3_9FUNG|nr:hypothetical protein HDU87_004287 [Geranomyces variabilis]
MRLDDGPLDVLPAATTARRPSMQGMQELPGIASITGRSAQGSNQLPLFQASSSKQASANATSIPQELSAGGRGSTVEFSGGGHTMLPSFKAFGQEALGDGHAAFNAAEQSRYPASASTVHYPAPPSTVPLGAPNASGALMVGGRMTLPPFNASSPVSKVPKPPAAASYKRESSSANRPSPLHSPNSSPTLGAAILPPPPASFFHGNTLSTISPFSSGAFGVPPYGTNYYSNMKRMESERRDSSTVLSKLPPPQSRTNSNLSDMDSLSMGALLHAAGGLRNGQIDMDGSGNSSGSDQNDSGDSDDGFGGRRRSTPQSETGETIGRVLNMGTRKADFEKAKHEARRKRKPGDVAVVNDERLTRLPRNVEEKHLGTIVYTGPRVRRPGSTRVEDIELFLLPRFTSEQHYSTIDVRVPAYLLSFKSNVATRRSAVWGTDVYTDDSDVVAMAIHSGWYKAVDSPDVQPAQLKEILAAARGGALSAGKSSNANPDVKEGVTDASLVETHTRLLVTHPLAPVMGTMDPYDGLPSHDLDIRLRILPRLVKYAGSLRNGIESRGWGASHDGESVRIEDCRAVAKGSKIVKLKKKEGATARNALARAVAVARAEKTKKRQRNESAEQPDLLSDVTVVFSESLGEACFKYSPKLLTEWPLYLREQQRLPPNPTREDALSSSSRKRRRHDPAGSVERDFSSARLAEMADWPYWRVRQMKDSLIFEDKRTKRYELTLNDKALELPDAHIPSTATYRVTEHLHPGRIDEQPPGSLAKNFVARNIGASDIEWTTEGLVLGGVHKNTVGVARFYWKRRHPPPAPTALPESGPPPPTTLLQPEQAPTSNLELPKDHESKAEIEDEAEDDGDDESVEQAEEVLFEGFVVPKQSSVVEKDFSHVADSELKPAKPAAEALAEKAKEDP